MEARNKIPEKLLCQFTGKLFLEPVKLPSGNIVEREAIEVRLDESGNGVDPFTGQPLTKKDLKLDKETRMQVNEFLREHRDRKEDRFIRGSLKRTLPAPTEKLITSIPSSLTPAIDIPRARVSSTLGILAPSSR